MGTRPILISQDILSFGLFLFRKEGNDDEDDASDQDQATEDEGEDGGIKPVVPMSIWGLGHQGELILIAIINNGEDATDHHGNAINTKGAIKKSGGEFGFAFFLGEESTNQSKDGTD